MIDSDDDWVLSFFFHCLFIGYLHQLFSDIFFLSFFWHHSFRTETKEVFTVNLQEEIKQLLEKKNIERTEQ